MPLVLTLGAGAWVGAPLPSFAGGGVGSGGDIFKDSRNPWFLYQNVKTVTYCIDFDPQSVSTTVDRARFVIQTAISYWNASFKNFHWSNSPWEAQVGLQDFVETPCTGAEDLRINLGWGSLDASQRDYFDRTTGGPAPQGTFQQILGIAVRTEYDLVRLRGRGFIYIASDTGPYAYDAGPAGIERAWSHDSVLFMIVLHELGHVFGLTHTGTLDGGIMAETLPEFAVMQFTCEQLCNVPITSLTAESGLYFDPPKKLLNLKPSDEVKSLLKIERTSGLLIAQAADGTYDWYEVRAGGTGERKIGISDNSWNTSVRFLEPMLVYYTGEQRVFPHGPTSLRASTGCISSSVAPVASATPSARAPSAPPPELNSRSRSTSVSTI